MKCSALPDVTRQDLSEVNNWPFVHSLILPQERPLAMSTLHPKRPMTSSFLVDSKPRNPFARGRMPMNELPADAEAKDHDFYVPKSEWIRDGARPSSPFRSPSHSRKSSPPRQRPDRKQPDGEQQQQTLGGEEGQQQQDQLMMEQEGGLDERLAELPNDWLKQHFYSSRTKRFPPLKVYPGPRNTSITHIFTFCFPFFA